MVGFTIIHGIVDSLWITGEGNIIQAIRRIKEDFGASIIKDGTILNIQRGKEIKQPYLLDFKDHRMIMAAAVAIVISGSDTTLCNPENVRKSYAYFFNDLQSLGVSMELQ